MRAAIESEWRSEQLERDRTASGTLAALGAALFPMWIPFDAMLAPVDWVRFAVLRLAVSAMFVSYLFVMRRIRTLGGIHGVVAAQMTVAASVIAALMTVSSDAYLPYGIGLSLVLWACGLALSLAAWRMAALQAVMMSPFVVASFFAEARTQDVAFVAFYLLTTGALCTGISAARLSGLRRVFETSRELALVQVKVAEERSANLAKSTFLARMSHELRTPLNAILGYSELVGEELRDSGVALGIDDLLRISRASAHLLSLIDDILDLSRIEAGELTLESKLIEVVPLLEDAVGELRNAANAKQIMLRTVFSSDVGILHTDPRRLRQIVINLLTNAVKFTDKGEVVLKVDRDGDGIRIEVHDTGVGIPPEAVDRVFDPFVQVDGSWTRRHGGTGLGLAIVHELAGLLGGTVALRSTLGVGTTFTVRLRGRVGQTASAASPRVASGLPVGR